jgi:hypothetical protein
MAGIFKKAMGLFVEFEEDPAKPEVGSHQTKAPISVAKPSTPSSGSTLNADELDKFEKHFEKIFDQANFPGPDYYEFWKMSETLEAHIADEKSRISATFASLAIQGLTKEALINTATKYKEIIALDKVNFERIVNEKSEKDIGNKRKELIELNEKLAKNADLIAKLTKEISEAQTTIGKLKTIVSEEENKLARNKQGYALASDAMIQKITDDVTKIQTLL